CFLFWGWPPRSGLAFAPQVPSPLRHHSHSFLTISCLALPLPKSRHHDALLVSPLRRLSRLLALWPFSPLCFARRPFPAGVDSFASLTRPASTDRLSTVLSSQSFRPSRPW